MPGPRYQDQRENDRMVEVMLNKPYAYKWSFSKSSYRDGPPSFYSTSLDGCIPKRILVGFSGLKWKNKDSVPLTEALYVLRRKQYQGYRAPEQSRQIGTGTSESMLTEGQVLRLLYKARNL